MEVVLITEDRLTYVKLAQRGKLATFDEINQYCDMGSVSFKVWLLEVNIHKFDQLDNDIINNIITFKHALYSEDVVSIQRFVDIYDWLIPDECQNKTTAEIITMKKHEDDLSKEPTIAELVPNMIRNILSLMTCQACLPIV